MTVWDTSTNAAVRSAFATKIADKGKGQVEERLIALADDESSSSDDEDDGQGGAAVGGSDEEEDESMDDA